MTYEYGTYSIPLMDIEFEYLNQFLYFDYPHEESGDPPRELVTMFARADGVEILEGPPQLVPGTEWLGESAQVWKYPARWGQPR